MKKNILSCLCFLLSVMCMGCGSTKKAELHTQEVVTAFERVDMKKINAFIFEDEEYAWDDEVAEDAETGVQEGILGDIFQRATVKVAEVQKDQIIYEITAPELTGIFDEFLENDTNLSDEEFREYLTQYIAQAQRRSYIVSLPYSVVDGEIKVNYQQKEFINAITGGMLEGYQKLYEKMLEEYAGGEES